MKRLWVFVLCVFAALVAGAAASADPPWIFGMHDQGGEPAAAEKGKTIWVVNTERLFHDRNDHSGPDYSNLTSAGHGVLARLNNDYKPAGTIPQPQYYDDFAERCGNFVAAAVGGCHIWIIGNEMNLSAEWPDGVEITPALYAQCFKKCRDNIKSRPGHANDSVIPGAIAPLSAPGVQWFTDMLNAIAALGSQPDGFAIHCYSWGWNADFISSDEKNADGTYKHFRQYRDYMNAIPSNMRSLPVYITETDPSETWWHSNIHWVVNAYKEIDDWNHVPGNQVIRSLCIYRWMGDQWEIFDNPYIVGDWKDAMANNYRWPTIPISSIIAAKAMSDLSDVAVRGVVTAKFPVIGTQDTIYIQSTGGSSGIKVASSATATLGDEVAVTGKMGTSAGERVLNATSVSGVQAGVGLPAPVGMTGRAMGGGTMGLQSAVIDDAVTSRYSLGLNNVGIVAKIWGRVTFVDPSGAFFYLDDGSGISDGSGHTGVRVACSGLPTPSSGLFTDVSGISGVVVVSGKVARLLRPRSTSDLPYATATNLISNPGFESGSLASWTPYGSAGIARSGSWFGGITAHAGSWFFGMATNGPAASSGHYQRVAAVAGMSYHGTAYSRVYRSGNLVDSTQNRVGIDPTGGIDPGAATVQWSATDTQPTDSYSVWRELPTPAVMCTGGYVTLFLDGQQNGSSGWHINCFDDAGIYLGP